MVPALHDYPRCPAEEYALEHVFPPVISACGHTHIKEDRELREL